MNRKEYNHQYYLKNKERIKANVKKYKEEHPEETRERNRLWIKKYRAEHKRVLTEEEKRKNRERYEKWRKKNGERYKEWRRKDYQENKEKYRERQRKYIESHKAHVNAKQRMWRTLNPEKVRENGRAWDKKTGSASNKVHHAIKKGLIEKEPCQICGRLPSYAHHCDYNKPLDVMWLCRKCHTEWHRKNKPIYYREDV